MKTRLLTTAAAFAVVGGALAVTPATANADTGAGSAQIAVGQASASAAKVRRFDFRRGWGVAWGTKSTKVVKGRMSDQRNDGTCIQARVAWAVKRGNKVRIFDRDTKTVCGVLAVAFKATPDYRGRPRRADRVHVAFAPVKGSLG
ncbi:hypothetical protein [Actinomadura rudentiformis]|uniref:RlpA-like protein double-psi beta-barrel domain-containing protein n=1 Tax=Actinomadura rudentiformis TaxID=359158 RepID=A0A6H9YW11_9ACTN|nr:hypothetical protein [Actinomadura rudentiformis]KAB2347999.1 hypothetical protein F8566_19195 [Actinomadura rudentiformis]